MRPSTLAHPTSHARSAARANAFIPIEQCEFYGEHKEGMGD
ncbi:unnamed protein product [Rhodiola kirilowii]